MSKQEYDVFEVDRQPLLNVHMQQRLKSIAAAGVVCALAGWIFLPLSSSKGIGENNSAEVASINPGAKSKVYHQGLVHYHWRNECPLAAARPIHPSAKRQNRPRISALRHEAEKAGLIPCGFCRHGN